jgi:hypothetical protein
MGTRIPRILRHAPESPWACRFFHVRSSLAARVGASCAERAIPGRNRHFDPSLSHGQMRVNADNLPAIQDLAERQDPSDLVMRRLQDFVNLQHFACLWGMVPASLTDEASPFNECAHSYLAGAHALLLHLQQMQGGDRTGVDALVNKIELEMLSENASLMLGRYSDEPSNTNEVIARHWSEIPFHPPSLVTFAALALPAGVAVLPMRRAWP